MATAAVVRESALPEHCPLRDPAAMAAFRDALRSGSRLSLRTQAFLVAKGRKDTGRWMRECLRQSQLLFRPWSMEILMLTGVFGAVRFHQLEETLGMSSRTLSNKLRALTTAGLLERTVDPGPPLRTSYALSRHGRATAAAASPLLAHLNLAAIGAVP
ncbi:MAG: winged helix-turn-helix transcriptional regulator [Halobacteriales archaeon]|nr:winged helix-turn-helix transcriptional regulator [Halobacteriales archaeon]